MLKKLIIGFTPNRVAYQPMQI